MENQIKENLNHIQELLAKGAFLEAIGIGPGRQENDNDW